MSPKGRRKRTLGTLACLWLATAGAHAQAVTLPVPLRPQLNDVWCWAAAGEMAMSYVDPAGAFPQCAIAEVNKGKSPCCGARPVDGCLAGGWLEFKDFAAFGFTNREANTLTWTRTRNEVAANRPIIVWTEDGHMVVVAGHNGKSGKQRKVYVKDPWPPADANGLGGDTSWSGFGGLSDKTYKIYHRIKKKGST